MSYIGALLIILGYILIIKKYSAGFLIQLAGCIIMILLYSGIDYGLEYSADYGIVLVNGVFAIINAWGFTKWINEE